MRPGQRCWECPDHTKDLRGCPKPRKSGPPMPQGPPSCPVLDVPDWMWALLDERRATQSPGRPARELSYRRRMLLDALDTALAQAEELLAEEARVSQNVDAAARLHARIAGHTRGHT